jgi:integrase
MKRDNPYTTGEKALVRKEAEAVIMAAKSYEDKLLVLIGFTLGPRRDDLVAIEIQNIDTKSGTLSYHEKKKGMRVKTVPISDRLIHELELYLTTHTVEGQRYLFPPRQKTSVKKVKDAVTKEVTGKERVSCQHMSSKTAYNIFNTLCKSVGVKIPIPIHAMRSTCIKLKQEEGWTIEQVAALIGDTVETVQEHYSTPSVGQLAQLMKEKGGI